MSKRLMLFCLLVLVTDATAKAATLQIEVPNGVASDASAICLVVAAEAGLPVLTNQQCAQVMFNKMLRQYKLKIVKAEQNAAARSTVDANVQAAMVSFDALVVHPVAVAACGDGVLDEHHGEQCDDGNTVSGDGCDLECQNE